MTEQSPLPKHKKYNLDNIIEIIEESKESLSSIRSNLSIIFPLSTLPKNKHHKYVAHAISAIDLACCILRDIECPKKRRYKS